MESPTTKFLFLLLLLFFPAHCYHFDEAVEYRGEKNDSNQPHGQGSLIFEDGSKVEGVFYEGYPHGHATQYFSNGSVCYRGQWRHGAKEGLGTSYYSPSSSKAGQLFYEGEYVNSFFDGQGKRYNLDGTIFQGSFLRGVQYHGQIVSNDDRVIAKVIGGHVIYEK